MTVLFGLLMVFSANAQNHNNHQHVETIVENAPLKLNGECTSWELDKTTTCVLVDGNRTKLWRRDCNHDWDNETFCWNSNPNDLDMVCTSWYREDTECISGDDGWVRECGDVRYKRHLCSGPNPNNQE